MPCTTAKTAGGFAIVCSGRQALPRCTCGERAPLLCDWKIGEGKTCDRPICTHCTVSPALGKDLCPDHAAAWKAWKAERTAP